MCIYLILFLGLTLIHELGHISGAKISGLRVRKFSILFAYTRVPELSQPDIKKHKKVIVYLLGPLFNLVFSWIVFVCMALFMGVTRVGTSNIVGSVTPESPAHKAGIQPGDRITGIDGQRIERWADISEIMRKHSGGQMTVTWSRRDSVFSTNMTPFKFECAIGMERNYRLSLGIVAQTQIQRLSFGEAIVISNKQFSFSVQRLFIYISKLVRGKGHISRLIGPVKFFILVGRSIRSGVYDILFLFAILGVYTGVINLFPFPSLDGGRIAFLGIEGMTSRQIPEKYRLFINALGALFLLFILVYVTINDIINL